MTIHAALMAIIAAKCTYRFNIPRSSLHLLHAFSPVQDQIRSRHLFFSDGYRIFRAGIAACQAHVAYILCFLNNLRPLFAVIGIDKYPKLEAALFNAFPAAAALYRIDTVLDHTNSVLQVDALTASTAFLNS